ncbi:MAG: flavin reductase [Clostridia bacterium]|nr:flavin reductase [Clostridia bacterium]
MKEISFTDAVERATLQLQKGVLVTAGTQKPNTMTVGWGGLNFYWNKPFFVAPVRASRFTYGLLMEHGAFTVSVPFEGTMKEALALCGTKSGRDIDKYAAAGLSLAPGKAVDTPIIQGCEVYFECVTRMKQPMEPDFVPEDVREKFYGNDDWHVLFWGEIVACYEV